MNRSDQPIPKLGVRSTHQRAAVIDVLRDTENFASAKVIYQALLTKGVKIGLTTVYRTLQSLSEVEAVDVLHTPHGETLYRHCQRGDHHHHLVCTRCGKTKEIEGGPVEKWAQSVADEFDFTLESHDAEVYGICPDYRI